MSMRCKIAIRLTIRMILGLAFVIPAEAQATSGEWSHLQGGKYGGAFFLDAQRGWLTADAHIMYTSDGGGTWDEAQFVEADENEGMRVDLRGMFIYQDALGDIHGWAVGDGGVVLQVTDAFGHVWGDLNDPNATNPGNRVLNECGLPATLYDIFMFKGSNGLYEEGWCVGEDGAIAVTEDAGLTWDTVGADIQSTFGCEPLNPDSLDAYVVHFFEDDPDYGVIASEYRHLYTTTDHGDSWTQIIVTLDSGVATCPPTSANIEWWGLEFDDPDDPSTGAWLVGGFANQTGFMYRTEDIFNGTWVQASTYDLLEAEGVPANCSPTTQYNVAVLSPGRAVSVGYGSQIFDRVPGYRDFDPCVSCDFLSPPGTEALTWVERDPPDTVSSSPAGPGKPLFRAIARLSSTEAVAAGGFGRIVHYEDDGMGNITITDQGSLNATRLNDGAFFDVGGQTHGVVTGQFLDITYTEDAGEHWFGATLGWDLDNSHQSRGIAFDPVAGLGFAVGDMLDGTFGSFSGKGFMAMTDGPSTEEYKSWVLMSVPTGTRTLYDVAIASTDCGGSEPLTAYAVGELGVVLKWTATGGSWVDTSPSGDIGTFFATSFADACTGYVAGMNSAVYRTEDGGDNWVSITVSSPESRIHDIATWGDGSSAIAVGDDGGVWTGGPRLSRVDFDALGLTVEEDLYDVEVIGDGDEIWISGDQGVLLHRNSSLQWSKPESRTTLLLPKVDFLSATEGYAAGITFTILKFE